jgi:hypothetical protein
MSTGPFFVEKCCCVICGTPFDTGPFDGLVVRHRQTGDVCLICKDCLDRYNETNPHDELASPECVGRKAVH